MSLELIGYALCRALFIAGIVVFAFLLSWASDELTMDPWLRQVRKVIRRVGR